MPFFNQFQVEPTKIRRRETRYLPTFSAGRKQATVWKLLKMPLMKLPKSFKK
jgi:hypothetical protein